MEQAAALAWVLGCIASDGFVGGLLPFAFLDFRRLSGVRRRYSFSFFLSWSRVHGHAFFVIQSLERRDMCCAEVGIVLVIHFVARRRMLERTSDSHCPLSFFISFHSSSTARLFARFSFLVYRAGYSRLRFHCGLCLFVSLLFL